MNSGSVTLLMALPFRIEATFPVEIAKKRIEKIESCHDGLSLVRKSERLRCPY